MNFLSSFGQNKKIDEILEKSYEFTMISNGDNVPNFYPTKDSIPEILVLLHNKVDITKIANYFGWTDNKLKIKIDFLIDANFIKLNNQDIYVPNVFICSIKESEGIKLKSKKIISETIKSIQKSIPSIKTEVAKIKSFENFDFENLSLLILSDVLLDNWQIENVEKEFLKTKRTERHSKNYYASYQQKLKKNFHEPLGIYGNQYEDTLSFSICRYGNTRYTKEVISKNEQLKKDYIINPKSFKYPVIDNLDYLKLQKIADNYKPELIKILNNYKTELLKGYENSSYSDEISFEEYFIWLYHIYYTEVTNELIKQRLITIPKEKVAFYILTNN